MTMRNKYVRRSRISEKKFRQLVKLFSLDLDAVQISELSHLNRNTVNRYLKAIRTRIAEFCELESPFNGEVVPINRDGAKRVKGKRGRGASGKTIVFVIFQRNGKVYTEIVLDARRKTLQDIIRGRVDLETVIHSDGWRGYTGLVDLGYKKHFRVHHGKNEFVRGKTHINAIESFWGCAKTRLSKFRGIHKNLFYLHLKECEFRFNYRHENIYQIILKIFINKPLN